MIKCNDTNQNQPHPDQVSHKLSVVRSLPRGKTASQTPRAGSLALQEPCDLEPGGDFPARSEVSLVDWWLSWDEWSLPTNILLLCFWLLPLSKLSLTWDGQAAGRTASYSRVDTPFSQVCGNPEIPRMGRKRPERMETRSGRMESRLGKMETGRKEQVRDDGEQAREDGEQGEEEWISTAQPPSPYPVASRRQVPYFGSGPGHRSWDRSWARGWGWPSGWDPLPLAIRPWVHCCGGCSLGRLRHDSWCCREKEVLGVGDFGVALLSCPLPLVLLRQEWARPQPSAPPGKQC